MMFDQMQKKTNEALAKHGRAPQQLEGSKEAPVASVAPAAFVAPVVKLHPSEPPVAGKSIVCGVSLPLEIHAQLRNRAKARKTSIKIEALLAIKRGL